VVAFRGHSNDNKETVMTLQANRLSAQLRKLGFHGIGQHFGKREGISIVNGPRGPRIRVDIDDDARRDAIAADLAEQVALLGYIAERHDYGEEGGAPTMTSILVTNTLPAKENAVPLDRATRTVVHQYFNRDEEPLDQNFAPDPDLREIVPEVKESILTLLDRCAGVEAVTKRGMTPRVPVSEIREMVVSKLGGAR